MRAPTLTRLKTAPPIWRRSCRRSPSPPSKRMIATEMETSGKSSGPRTSSGRINPVMGPARKPSPKREDNGRQFQSPGEPLRADAGNDDAGDTDKEMFVHGLNPATAAPGRRRAGPGSGSSLPFGDRFRRTVPPFSPFGAKAGHADPKKFCFARVKNIRRYRSICRWCPCGS